MKPHFEAVEKAAEAEKAKAERAVEGMEEEEEVRRHEAEMEDGGNGEEEAQEEKAVRQEREEREARERAERAAADARAAAALAEQKRIREEQLMMALHAQLPYDFLGDAGVKLSMQTTYLDETLRITRCTTRSLAASSADVASSSTRIEGSRTMARAIATRCF